MPYRRLRILETNYGRECGWYVERDCRRVAALTDCRWHDMFWDSYAVEALTTDPQEQRMLFADEFWNRFKELTFRNREFGAVATHAFPCIGAGTVLNRTGRLVVRGLYLVVPSYPWDRLLLWARRRRRRWQGGTTKPVSR